MTEVKVKKRTYLYLGIFLCGVIAANILGIAFAKNLGMINTYYMNRYLYTDTLGRELFVYLFYHRVPEWLLLLVLSIGIYKTIVVDCYITYICFSAGFLSVISIMNYGINGIGLAFAFYFPQWLFYGPMIGIWFMALKYYKQKKMHTGIYVANKKNQAAISFVLCMFVAGICMVMGVFLESYVNPHVLKWIIGYLQG